MCGAKLMMRKIFFLVAVVAAAVVPAASVAVATAAVPGPATMTCLPAKDDDGPDDA